MPKEQEGGRRECEDVMKVMLHENMYLVRRMSYVYKARTDVSRPLIIQKPAIQGDWEENRLDVTTGLLVYYAPSNSSEGSWAKESFHRPVAIL